MFLIEGILMGLMVGRVVGDSKHPRADRLRLAQVFLGDGTTRQIVYGGGRQLVYGDLVPVAPPGTRMWNGTKLRRRTYRGEASYGMLCSLTELGWDPDGPDEVFVLPTGIMPGLSLERLRYVEELVSLVTQDVVLRESSPQLISLLPDVAPLRTRSGTQPQHA